jgi:hypothetical protein
VIDETGCIGGPSMRAWQQGFAFTHDAAMACASSAADIENL